MIDLFLVEKFLEPLDYTPDVPFNNNKTKTHNRRNKQKKLL
jgi:hypothetical protein